MVLFSIKLITAYVMFEKVLNPLVCVCVSVSLIFAYRRPLVFFPKVFNFFISCMTM